MSALLKAKDISLDELLEVIEALEVAKQDGRLRCWTEAPDGWAFDWWPGRNGQMRCYGAGRMAYNDNVMSNLGRSTTGRLFSPGGELRWRQLSSTGSRNYRCVFLGQSDWVGSLLDDKSTELADLKSERQQHLLWGQQSDRSPGEWIELRIPHRFRYPIDVAAQRVVLELEYWRDTTENLHFVRYCDLHAYQETH